ncbi:MAG: tetratricopeptide repeat protein [Alistipes sp.]|nr:tetratricopeptide repeat protein [Alistipes sp.]
MRRQIISFLALFILAATSVDAMAQGPDIAGRKAEIEDMLTRGRWGEAHEALVALERDINPIDNRLDVEWVRFEKVHTSVELGVADAEAMMKNFIENHPSSIYRNDMLFMLASYYTDNGMMADGERIFAEVDYKALDARERERYDMRMGYIRFTEADYPRAKTHLKRVSKISDYYPHAQYYLAYMHYLDGEFISAEEIFRTLASTEEYSSLAPFYLLQIEYRRANYDYVITEGEKLLNQAMPATRDDLIRIIAESYFIKGDYAQAARYIVNLSSEAMGRQENYILGYSLYRMARYSDAVAPLKAVCGYEDALTQNAAYHLGDCYVKLGNKPSAADAFAMATAEGEGYDVDIARESLLNYGRLKYELGGGLFNEATAVLQQYLERYPGSPRESEVKQLLIASYYNSEDYDAAYIALREYPNPDNEIKSVLQRVALFRAVSAIEKRDWDLAERLLKESEEIGLQPKYNALVLYWQGEVAFAKGDMALAREKYEAYVRRAPKSAVEYQFAHYGIGYSYFNEGDMANAAEAFDEFVRDYTKRDDYLFDAQNRLGDSHFTAREFTEARNAYKISINSSSEHRHYARYQLALLEGIDKKPTLKSDMLRGIINDGEGDYVDDAWYELGRSYIAQERYADGATTLQDFVDSDTTSPYYVAAMSDLALAYYNLGKQQEAIACYERVVEFDPQSASALEAIRSLRDIYVKEDKVDEYLDYAERNGVQSDLGTVARDSLTFAAAKNIYLAGEMGEAREKLTNYLREFENGYNRTEALFYLSDCHMYLDDNISAMQTMDELLQQGRNQYTERVLDVYSRMSFDMELYDKSAWAYRSLYDEASSKDRRAEASEGYVDAAALTEDSAAIKQMYADIANMEDATLWARNYAKLVMADVLREEGDAQAYELYASLAENPMTEEGAEAYYRMVEQLYLAGDYEGAQQRVFDMGECGSSYWQAKIFILLGETFAKTGNTFQARATFQSIVDGYMPKDDGIVDEAKQHIANLPK